VKHVDQILAMSPGPEATAALAAWIQGLFRDAGGVPVLVGGAAVELYTGGNYVTGDLDFVGSVPTAVARKFEAAGFRREGRHWVHEGGQAFVEFPAAHLQVGDRAAVLRVGRQQVVILGLEETLVDRLAAWAFWTSEVDGVAAFELWRRRAGELDRRRLAMLARAREVEPALRRLERFARNLGKRRPSAEEISGWARQT
jgi:hypothetical protein